MKTVKNSWLLVAIANLALCLNQNQEGIWTQRIVHVALSAAALTLWGTL